MNNVVAITSFTKLEALTTGLCAGRRTTNEAVCLYYYLNGHAVPLCPRCNWWLRRERAA